MASTTLLYDAAPKVPLTEFLPEIEFEFSDAPSALLTHTVRRVISRLCDAANVLRRQSIVKTQTHVAHYKLNTVDDVDLIAVMRLTQHRAKFCASLPKRVPAPDGATGCSFCCGPTQVWVEHGELVFSTPRCGDEYIVDLSVKPTRESCEVDEVLLTDYFQTILTGVRATLCSMVDKPWSSWERSQQAEAVFRKECSDAAIRAMLHNQRGAFKAGLPRAF